jgi:hypothetical protein
VRPSRTRATRQILHTKTRTSMDLSVETSCLASARPHLVDPLRPSPALLHPPATAPATAVVFLHTDPSALHAIDPQKLDPDALQGASRVCLTPARNAVAEGAALPECAANRRCRNALGDASDVNAGEVEARGAALGHSDVFVWDMPALVGRLAGNGAMRVLCSS